MNDEEYRKEIGRRAEIEKHFADGGEVEYQVIGPDLSAWMPAEHPLFDWNRWNYRKAEHKAVVEFNPYEGDFVIWHVHDGGWQKTSLKGLRFSDANSIYVRIPSELVEKFR